MKKVIAFLLVLGFASVAFAGHPVIDYVKAGKFEKYGAVEIGTIFNAVFDNPSWGYELSDKGQHFVIFTGNISKRLQKDACAEAGVSVEELESARSGPIGPYWWKVGEPAKVVFEVSENGGFWLRKIESRAWSHPIAPTEKNDLLKIIYR
jgi:hypothetical protein